MEAVWPVLMGKLPGMGRVRTTLNRRWIDKVLVRMEATIQFGDAEERAKCGKSSRFPQASYRAGLWDAGVQDVNRLATETVRRRRGEEMKKGRMAKDDAGMKG